MIRPGLTLTELGQLSLAIARNGEEETTDAQLDRIIKWAETARADAHTLEHVLAGDLAVRAVDGRDLEFKITAQGREKLRAKIDEAFSRFKDVLKKEGERITARERATKGNALVDLIEQIFGKKTEPSNGGGQ